MSIDGTIEAAIAQLYHERRLSYLPPLVPSARTGLIREVFVSKEVNGVVMRPWDDDEDGPRFAELRAVLDQFSLGTRLTVSAKRLNKPHGTVLARVEPHNAGVWAIRSLYPGAGIRCFGFFGKRDQFLALNWQFRENIHGDNDWRIEVNEAVKMWKDLFGPLEPNKGKIDECLSKYTIG